MVWTRPLGEGYSAPVVENGVLYTMYGRSRDEVVIAANAETGQTLWEQASPRTFESEAAGEMGDGPYASPLIAGDRLFTAGVAGRFQCFDKRTGKLLWTQDLWGTHKGSQLLYGYASSPIAFRDLVIVPVGGPGKSVMAFRQADGGVAWAQARLRQRLFVADPHQRLGPRAARGADGRRAHRRQPAQRRPAMGGPVQGDYAIAIATPVYGPDNLLFVSSEYDGGAKVIELQRQGLQTKATELWSNIRFRLHHGNAMRIGEAIYFSSGGKGSQPILSAVEARSGKTLWQERSIGKATFVWADQS